MITGECYYCEDIGPVMVDHNYHHVCEGCVNRKGIEYKIDFLVRVAFSLSHKVDIDTDESQ